MLPRCFNKRLLFANLVENIGCRFKTNYFLRCDTRRSPAKPVKFFVVLAGAISWKKPGEDIVFLVNEFDAR